MKSPATLAVAAAAALALGCTRSPSTAPLAPEPVATPPVADQPPAVAPVAVEMQPEPTPEEKKKAEEAQKLEEDWTKLAARHEAELARLTPEIRAAAKALTDKAYPSTRAAISAALTGAHRSPGHLERDGQRHPLETLEFLGLLPTQTVLEYGPGEGWYTELLAPALANRGKLKVTMTDPNGPKTERSTLYGQRTKLFLERLPEAYGKVEAIVIDPKAPNLGPDASVDLVLLFRGAHGLNNNQNLPLFLAEFRRVLKPGGRLGVEQHRAPPGANPDESSKKGYLPEAWLIEQIEAAGFKLQAKSEINANPKDTKDHPEGVWTLPPTLRLGETDKAKYLAIGESDRMTLRFVKVNKKAQAGGKP
jgi:predicted methyltransferase